MSEHVSLVLETLEKPFGLAAHGLVLFSKIGADLAISVGILIELQFMRRLQCTAYMTYCQDAPASEPPDASSGFSDIPIHPYELWAVFVPCQRPAGGRLRWCIALV
jgi:hypothetical protein